MKITVSSKICRTPRVQQIEGMFDIPEKADSIHSWDAELALPAEWSIGLVVGPSGSGKSTVAKSLWPAEWARAEQLQWHPEQSVLDAFPETMSVKEVVSLLSSVGFSSPPSWLKPYHVLSTGEKFRVLLARTLAENPGLSVIDEYTSVVDRTVAKIASAALAKTVRARGQQFIAVSCHEDVEEWLQPDWVYRPATNTLTRRLLRGRPEIPLTVLRCKPQAWALFRQHHYLSSDLNNSSICFLAVWDGRPVAFSSWLQLVDKFPAKREHRTVTLPDYQGVGIGHRLSTYCASLFAAFDQRVLSTTTHPAFVAARSKDPNWRLTRRPGLGGTSTKSRQLRRAITRLTAGFEYVGPPMDRGLAQRMLHV